MIMIQVVSLYNVTIKVLKSKERGLFASFFFVASIFIVPDHHMDSLVLTFEYDAITRTMIFSFPNLPVVPSCA